MNDKESNELFEIKRLLQTVGNQTFIKYYTEFQSKKNINFALLFKNENSIMDKIIYFFTFT